MAAVLEVKDLKVEFPIDGEYYSAIEKLSFSIHTGETLGLVGESGCGKSVTSLAIMGLLHPSARVRGQVLLDGRNLLKLTKSQFNTLRGNRLSMIFQEPMSALNPVLRIKDQVGEGLMVHKGLTKRQAERATLDLLKQVGLKNASDVASAYPHQLSGGMQQRVMIAMAVACNPSLLIADEPTTALDVTIQAQILKLLQKLAEEHQMAMLFITHNLGVVARIAQRVAIMYAGRIVEHGFVRQIFKNPCHPYTIGLLNSVPRIDGERHRLESIPGHVPSLRDMPAGCKFRPRCANPECLCRDSEPDLGEVEPGHQCRTWQYANTGVSGL
ncbi:ABC transporter ATP-binding protein [Alicyclobacillus mengziensis]|uniref:ABC transporter ATP-binding protein n=1 Tax=Alicyclobacillus mengziensis TaxID=2931921 RepID=A0A9X7Z6V2_9BACL|nr:ABC transporter ATP-binding protein [Alicyclobacillus mengziensis]QSO46655.1 ABC transporter ATP-binding protein [Alicyclobacillus mengziensis]